MILWFMDGFYMCLRKFFGFLNGEPPAALLNVQGTPADGSNTFDPDGSLWHYLGKVVTIVTIINHSYISYI
jgi:hypothetical protein